MLTVADTGAGIETVSAGGTGIGLANIRERLALLYGDDALLELEENEPRGFVARIHFPAAIPTRAPRPCAGSSRGPALLALTAAGVKP